MPFGPAVKPRQTPGIKLTNGNHDKRGTIVCLDLPIGHLHHYSYEALEKCHDSIRCMYDAINLARKYARMLEL